MLLEPDPPRARVARDEHPQRRRTGSRAAAIAPIVYNLAIIGGGVFLAPDRWASTALAIGVVAGSACHLARPAPAAPRGPGSAGRRRIDLGDAAARQALAADGPAGARPRREPAHVPRRDVARVGPRRPAPSRAFNVAFTVLQIPIGVIGVPLGIVMLPSLSRDLARGDVTQYVSLVSRALRLILCVMLPLAGLTIVLRTEIVTLLFGYGRFDEHGVALTAAALICLSLALASDR